MRIAIDARYLDDSFSGIGTYSRQLLENLAAIDRENHYFVLVNDRFRGTLELGPNFEVLSDNSRPVSLRTLGGIGRTLEKLRLDAIHSTFPMTPLDTKVRRILTVHDLQPFLDPDFSARRARVVRWAYNRFYRWCYPACMRACTWAICHSFRTRDDVAALMPSQVSKLIVVHSGIEPKLLEVPAQETIVAAAERHHLDRPYALYFGSTRPNKNIPAMLRAFAKVLRKPEHAQDDIVFALILKKDRFFRSIERAIRNHSLQERVRVLEQVPEEDKQALLAGARAMFFATKYEGFGYPLLEAMALGVPTLAGDSGSLPEIAGDCALLVNPFDTESIAEGMSRILRDGLLRQRLRADGPARARQFDPREMAERVKNIYELLV